MYRVPLHFRLLIQQLADFFRGDSARLAVFGDDGVLAESSFCFQGVGDCQLKTCLYLLAEDIDINQDEISSTSNWYRASS